MTNDEAKIRKFTDLRVWQQARILVKDIYVSCESYPGVEQYGLVNQMKRAVVSIASNIAEGFKRRSNKDKLHFYVMGSASLTELQNQLILSSDLGFISEETYTKLMYQTDNTDALLNGLIRATKGRA